MNFIGDFISNHGILVSGALLILTYIFIALEKIPKVTIAIIGAALTYILGLIPANKAFEHIEFNVIFLLIGMMIIVHITAKSGVFDYIAIRLLKKTKGHPMLIMIVLATITAFASALLDNVTTVLIIMPVTFAIAKDLDIDVVPFLITEILASNIGGAATLIGDPPNLIIGAIAGLSFNDFILELTPIILVIYLVCLLILLLWFKKDLTYKHEYKEIIAKMDHSQTITNNKLMIRSVSVLGLVILGFLAHGALHLEPYVIAMLGAGFLMIFEDPKETLYNVEWITIFFFVGLFIIIGGVIESGGIAFLANKITHLTNGDMKIASFVILWASGILSGIVDNIPYTATMAPVIKTMVVNGNNTHPLWWSLSLGACLGGNATIIGAAANVIVSETAYSEGKPIGFIRFLKYGVVITFVSLLLSTVYLYFRFFA